MDQRYRDARVDEHFNPTTQYALWLQVGSAVVSSQGRLGLIPEADAYAILGAVHPKDIGDDDVTAIRGHERRTGHDVAAFLAWWGSKIRSASARWIHFGLTSSDLVETAMGLRFKGLRPHQETQMQDLISAVGEVVERHAMTFALGHTHGQPAEPTTLGVRAQQWLGMLCRADTNLQRAWYEMEIAKLSGPVGTYAHNPPEMERDVAHQLGLWPNGPGASQVIPRDRLAAWASAAAQAVSVCGKIAMDFRTMAARGEVREDWWDGRVGSSAMPHKKNPVTAEQITGMGRLARGYAEMLQQVDLWDERDISHSCVERVAVPDLMHVLFHTLRVTRVLIDGAGWQAPQMAANLRRAGRKPYSAWRALEAQRDGATRHQARRVAEEWARSANTDGPVDPGATALLQNHPLLANRGPGNPGLTTEQPGQ